MCGGVRGWGVGDGVWWCSGGFKGAWCGSVWGLGGYGVWCVGMGMGMRGG